MSYATSAQRLLHYCLVPLLCITAACEYVEDTPEETVELCGPDRAGNLVIENLTGRQLQLFRDNVYVRCMGRGNAPFIIYDIPDQRDHLWQAYFSRDAQAQGREPVSQKRIVVSNSNDVADQVRWRIEQGEDLGTVTFDYPADASACLPDDYSVDVTTGPGADAQILGTLRPGQSFDVQLANQRYVFYLKYWYTNRSDERVSMPTVPTVEAVLDSTQMNRDIEIMPYPLTDRERETRLVVYNQLEMTIDVYINNLPIENRLRDDGVNGFIEAGRSKGFRLPVDYDTNTDAIEAYPLQIVDPNIGQMALAQTEVTLNPDAFTDCFVTNDGIDCVRGPLSDGPPELFDRRDNDCDGEVDEGPANCGTCSGSEAPYWTLCTPSQLTESGAVCMEQDCIDLNACCAQLNRTQLDDGCGDCETGWQGEQCDQCAPDCDEQICGDDGCGGTCGECSCGHDCTESQCLQTNCDDRECGSDGCDGTCGECADGLTCVDGACEMESIDDGVLETRLDSPIDSPCGLAVDAAHLWIGDCSQETATLVQMDRDAAISARYDLTGDTILDMAITPSGLFILQLENQSKTLIRFDLMTGAGEQLDLAADTLTGVAFDGLHLCFWTNDERIERRTLIDYELAHRTPIAGQTGPFTFAGDRFFRLGMLRVNGNQFSADVDTYDAADLLGASQLDSFSIDVDTPQFSGLAAWENQLWVVGPTGNENAQGAALHRFAIQ